jgi:pimeloyl-ACP methyl ester carboxylesterase
MRRHALTLIAPLLLLLLAGCQTDLVLVDLKARWAGPSSRFLPMDGIEVHWRDEGPAPLAPGAVAAPAALSAASPASSASSASSVVADAEPPAILLLHGTGSSLHTWDGWARQMSPTVRVVRLDLPGFGLTGPHPSGDYSGTATVDFLERFADAAGLKRFAIAGNSLGGYFAWRFALRHPDRVSALVLIDAVGYPIEPGTSGAVALELARMPVVSELMRFAPIRGMVERSLKDTYGDDSKVTPELVDRYEQLILRPGNRTAMGDRARAERRPVGWQRLPELRVPTLIQWGGADRWVPIGHAERFRKDIPDSRLVLYPSLGHLPMEEDPQTTARDAMTFLRGGTVPGQK